MFSQSFHPKTGGHFWETLLRAVTHHIIAGHTVFAEFTLASRVRPEKCEAVFR